MPSPGSSGAGTGTTRTPDLAEVLGAGLPAYTPHHPLPPHHRKTLHAILACRTPVLGGHRYACAHCRKQHWVAHSCRNRHCPTCQGAAALRWLAHQQAALLPVGYFHLVFTLPHTLNPLLRQNQAQLFKLLFDTAAATLVRFGRETLRAQIGVTAVLHTWSQTLLDHTHLHCVVTGGGLSADRSRWIPSHPRYLFPVRALSRVFRAKFCEGLRQLHATRQLDFHGQLDPLQTPTAFGALLRQLHDHAWVVYAKRPFAGPQQVLTYLSRYTHRVAISNRRLLALNRAAQTVTFAYRDNRQKRGPRTMTLSLAEFIRRFRLHILPHRFVKIRHYGLLGNRHRHRLIPHTRQLLGIRSPPPTKSSTETPTVRCPFCGCTQLIVLEVTRPAKAPPPSTSILDSS